MEKVAVVLIVLLSTFMLVNGGVPESTRFTTDFYRHVFNSNENSVYSPVSFRILLSLCYQSAISSTELQLKEKSYFGTKAEESQSQIQSLEKLAEGGKINIVNRIYLSKTSDVNQKFNQSISTYKTSVEKVDFRDKEASAQNMNEFVERETHGLIKNLISPETISEDTILFLINTVYFKAKWARKFSAPSMREGPFHAIDGKTYNITYMSDSHHFKVAKPQGLNSKVLELPYEEGTHYKLWVVLPNEDSNINEVKDKLNDVVITNIANNFEERSLSLKIPAFEIETSVDGKESLRKLGISDLFDKHDLVMSTGDNLAVAEARQKSKIIVNNEGTEASSATYLRAVARMMRPSFKIDRPFIFLILQETTNEIVFIGHYSQPH